jgi:hypothetical protein
MDVPLLAPLMMILWQGHGIPLRMQRQQFRSGLGRHRDRCPRGFSIGVDSYPKAVQAAKQHIVWARRQLLPSWRPWDFRRTVWHWLKNLPARYQHGDYLFVCGTPREAEVGILEVLAKVNEERLRDHFSCSSRITVVGTISRPGFITENDLAWRTATDIGSSIILPPHKVILCPGGVDQPRDHDPRACYAIMAGPRVTWHRVTYDIEQAIARVKAAQGIDMYMGERLRVGG